MEAPVVKKFSMDYANRVVMAPMVRVGSLPMRLLALEMGADIVYTEETIDKKIIPCERVVNDVLQSVDFVTPKDRTVVLRTCHADHPNVFQIGTADPLLALKAAETVSQDVDGIDINMGCPKHFSTSGGMGAALLTKPQTIHDILTTLLRNIPNPVTCKIRLRENMAASIDLVKMIEKTGVRAIAVHGRTKDERPKDPAHWDSIKEIVETCRLSIPLIANGDVFAYEDIAKVKAATGCSSVMIARAAQWNVSVFRREGLLPIEEVMTRYLRKAMLVDYAYQNTKFVLMEMLGNIHQLESERGKAVTHSKSMRDIALAWGLEAEYDTLVASRKPANNGSMLGGKKHRAEDPVDGEADACPAFESSAEKRLKEDTNGKH